MKKILLVSLLVLGRLSFAAENSSFTPPERLVFCATSLDVDAIDRAQVAQALYDETRATLMQSHDLARRIAGIKPAGKYSTKRSRTEARKLHKLHKDTLAMIDGGYATLRTISTGAGPGVGSLPCATDEEYAKVRGAVALADRLTRMIHIVQARTS